MTNARATAHSDLAAVALSRYVKGFVVWRDVEHVPKEVLFKNDYLPSPS